MLEQFPLRVVSVVLNLLNLHFKQLTASLQSRYVLLKQLLDLNLLLQLI